YNYVYTSLFCWYGIISFLFLNVSKASLQSVRALTSRNRPIRSGLPGCRSHRHCSSKVRLSPMFLLSSRGRKKTLLNKVSLYILLLTCLICQSILCFRFFIVPIPVF